MFPKELSIESTVILNNGVRMPVFGLGTYLSTGRVGRKAVLEALKMGYRHIDTAALYDNEREVGEAVRQSGIPREEIFVTSKLWNSDHGYRNTLDAFERSRNRLGFDHIDLYLLHWPVEGLRQESWRALEHLYEEGKCRAIGVSNYMQHHLHELFDHAEIIPAVNQVEFSPFLYLEELLELCRTRGIQLESYSPLTKGQRLDDPRLLEIAEKYGKTSAQLLVRWVMQHEVIVIPKSSDRGRIRENSRVFDFTISKEDMARMDGLNMDLRTSWDPSGAP